MQYSNQRTRGMKVNSTSLQKSGPADHASDTTSQMTVESAKMATRANFPMYEQILTSCFDKIKKQVPRKCKELKELCDQAAEQVKSDAEDEVLSANKYFKILKLAFDTKNPRLNEQLLYAIQKLVAHGFLDGNAPDDCMYPEDERPRANGVLARRLIDSIIDEVCRCISGDNQVQLQVVRALLTLVATKKTEVHEKSLLKALSSLYYIHVASANNLTNQNTARASLIQFIKIVFGKMEASETNRRLSTGQPLSTLT
jgi:brefeldin A-inhibited guanine nucleotide-exchange protein